MRRTIVLTLLATTLVATPAKRTSPHAKTGVKTPSAHYVAAASHGRSRYISHSGRKTTRHPRAAPVPSYQLHPDPERYQQIQQALAEKGYFKGPVNGQWDDDSVSALRQFQVEQKLDGDGKLTALSLTGLGLGPKHDGTTASAVPLSAVTPTASPGPDTEGPPPLLPQ